MVAVRKYKRIVIKSLDKIITESKKIANDYDINNGKSISIIALKVLIDKSKFVIIK